MTNEAHEQKKGVSIHIDRQQVFAPRPSMTGGELRTLVNPHIGANRDLYLELHSQGQDRLIGDNEMVQLAPGMHFYTAPKTINPGTNR